jgi:hypothetical protein
VGPLVESMGRKSGVVAVAQLAEHQVVVLGVGGSSPLGHPPSGAGGRWRMPSLYSSRALSSARLERQTLNLRVTGSNPVGPTIGEVGESWDEATSRPFASTILGRMNCRRHGAKSSLTA